MMHGRLVYLKVERWDNLVRSDLNGARNAQLSQVGCDQEVEDTDSGHNQEQHSDRRQMEEYREIAELDQQKEPNRVRPGLDIVFVQPPVGEAKEKPAPCNPGETEIP